MRDERPGLFGLNKTNRDFTIASTWGKNQFNSSFPASLCCYLGSLKMQAVYLSIQKEQFLHSTIEIKDIFGIAPDDSDTYFAFESQHTPYQRFVIGTLPGTDLVIQKESNGQCLRGLEVKLTALPDNTTCDLPEESYGSELVVRPDTIVYLACSIAMALSNTLSDALPEIRIGDWRKQRSVLTKIDRIIDSIGKIALAVAEKQQPFLLQPIWKTTGKSPILAKNCLDMFVWSNAGFAYFISSIAGTSNDTNGINRQTRTAIWLYRMLLDIKNNGRFDHEQIIDILSYNTRNDKAFASSGNITNKYMACERLESPSITKDEIKNIILGGGQHLLSPERRFDAILFNTPELFK